MLKLIFASVVRVLISVLGKKIPFRFNSLNKHDEKPNLAKKKARAFTFDFFKPSRLIRTRYQII